MGERRFVIYDATDGAKFEPAVIPLSELKWRLVFASELLGLNPEKAIDILLHGEAKEQPDPARCVCGKPYGHLSACNPDPPKQPDVWEAWVQRMPRYGNCDSGVEWEDNLQHWFREMPRKEQP